MAVPKTVQSASVASLSFGCRLNSHESEIMARYAESGSEFQNRDLLIVNSCAVTREAERQTRQAIRRAARENPDRAIIVTGCASELAPEKWLSLPGVVRHIPNPDKLAPESWGLKKEPEPVKSAHTRALVQIQQGCDHRCTFCVIPFGRGKAKSMSFAIIADRIRALLEMGHLEVVLTGVDIASWVENGKRLGQLCLDILETFPNLARLRLSSIDPALFHPDSGDPLLWKALEHPRFMPNLHLSLQAGSDLILKRMKRRHSVRDALHLLEKARAIRPLLGAGADIIAGFPTETETLFAESAQFIRESGIPFLHVFPYSERPGTPAARMPATPKPVRQERAAILRQLGEENRRVFLEQMLGRKTEVLLESPDSGLTPNFIRVHLEKPLIRQTGRLVDIRIIGQKDSHLIAAPLHAASEAD